MGLGVGREAPGVPCQGGQDERPEGSVLSGGGASVRPGDLLPEGRLPGGAAAREPPGA